MTCSFTEDHHYHNSIVYTYTKVTHDDERDSLSLSLIDDIIVIVIIIIDAIIMFIIMDAIIMFIIIDAIIMFIIMDASILFIIIKNISPNTHKR